VRPGELLDHHALPAVKQRQVGRLVHFLRQLRNKRPHHVYQIELPGYGCQRNQARPQPHPAVARCRNQQVFLAQRRYQPLHRRQRRRAEAADLPQAQPLRVPRQQPQQRRSTRNALQTAVLSLRRGALFGSFFAVARFGIGGLGQLTKLMHRVRPVNRKALAEAIVPYATRS